MKLRLAYSADPVALRDPSPRRRGHLALAHSIATPKRDPVDVQREQLAAFGLSLAFVRLRGAVDDGGDPKGPAMTRALQMLDDIALRDALERSIRRFSPTLRGRC